MREAHHIVLPGQVVRRAMPLACETPAMFLARTGWPTTILPTICTINGTPVMRAQWASRMIGPQDRLAFVSRPLGPSGGGSQSKQVLGLVAMIGLSMILPGIGPALGGGLMGAFGQGAVMLGGSFLVSTLVNVKAGGDTSGSDAGTVYSFGQQRNSARILQPIAVRYGRTKAAPAYAAVPWAEYIGNDQYLNILAVRGVGRYDTESIYVDDTLLWTKADGIASGFRGVKIEFYEPGEEISLFPLNVSTSAEVGGQELSEEWAGGFVSAAAGTTTTALAIDFAAPGGLYLVNDAGEYVTYMVNVQAQYRAVNDLGLPTGDWVQLANPLLKAASKTARRWSFKIDVPPGRYEVRVRRGKAEWDDDSNTANDIVWMGLRAFLTGPQSFADVSTIALRLKATQQLTDASAQNIRDISTRILPVFNGAVWVDQPTRNPAWAFWDMATNARYGAKRAPSKVDAQAVWQLAQTADSRGDKFDFEFSSAVSVPEAFDTALGAVRSKHRWSGDTLTLVRDQWQAVPSMLLTDRETVRGTFRADYEFLPADGVDAIIAEYVDQDTWQVEEVQYPPDYVASNPKRVELRGIVQRAQAFREAGFLFRQSQYRRVSPSLETEHDGRLIALGDHVLIQSDMPGAWGAAGAVVARTGNTLTLEPPPKWESGKDHYISLRSKTGEPFGPIKCTRASNDAKCTLNAADLALVEANQGMALADVLARADGAQLPTYAHGVGQSWQRRCIALSGAPSGDRVALSFVVDDERVHDDDGVPDPLPSMPPMAIPVAPLVAGLIAQLQQNVMEPVLSASWWPAAGATLYRARVSRLAAPAGYSRRKRTVRRGAARRAHP
ncbi:host specificity factor TipJ family phage tail protein [Castellaniella sp.]|uniref:host specificity factor TipJ family phage tail protein n=1 Tax=Castellaniella sp. TaxID=1955812 RepID=UPI002AFDCDF0|nr:host specificity factor TipJ family phage tail protein [Castellaniella sp.]